MTEIKNRDLKKRARIILTNRHSFFALITVTVAALDLLLTNIVNYAFPSTYGIVNSILYWVSTVITNMVSYLILAGAMGLYLNLCRDRQCRVSDLWTAFTCRPEQIAIYSVVQFILQMAAGWGITVLLGLNYTSPFFVGAVIIEILFVAVQLGLSMVLFIYCDNRYISAPDMIKQSWRMMRGHRMKLLGLEISFIGVLLLCILSLGIGFLFIRPYMYAALALFYLNVCGSSAEQK